MPSTCGLPSIELNLRTILCCNSSENVSYAIPETAVDHLALIVLVNWDTAQRLSVFHCCTQLVKLICAMCWQ